MRPERLLALIIVLGVVAALAVLIALLDAPADGSAVETGAPPLSLEEARVVHVTDGDTVTVEIDGQRERLRYIGIDAPELANPDAGLPAECGADEATAANRALVADELIGLERDVTDRDRFGRLLRHAWLPRDGGWHLVGELLVAEGAVEARSFPPDTLHDARLDELERVARTREAGIWGAC